MTIKAIKLIAAAIVANDAELAAIGEKQVAVVISEIMPALRIVARSRALCPTPRRTVEVHPGQEVAI